MSTKPDDGAYPDTMRPGQYSLTKAAQESRRAEFDAEMRSDAFGEKP